MSTPAPPAPDPAGPASSVAGDPPLWDPLALPYAPRRARPLSLRNPLDYGQLLFWAFAFPQALRWYVEHFGALPASASAWQSVRKDPTQRHLALAGLILVGIESLLTGLVVYLGQALLNPQASVPNLPGNVILGAALGVLVALVLAGAVGLRWGVARGVVLGVLAAPLLAAGGSLVRDAASVVVGVGAGFLLGVALGAGLLGGLVGLLIDGVRRNPAEPRTGDVTASLIGGALLGATAFLLAFLLPLFSTNLGLRAPDMLRAHASATGGTVYACPRSQGCTDLLTNTFVQRELFAGGEVRTGDDGYALVFVGNEVVELGHNTIVRFVAPTDAPSVDYRTSVLLWLGRLFNPGGTFVAQAGGVRVESLGGQLGNTNPLEVAITLLLIAVIGLIGGSTMAVGGAPAFQIRHARWRAPLFLLAAVIVAQLSFGRLAPYAADAPYVADEWSFGLPLSLAAGFFVLGLLRVDMAAAGWIINLAAGRRQVIPVVQRVSPLAISGLGSAVQIQLAADWGAGLALTEGLLRYSAQFQAPAQAIRDVLKQTPPDQLLARIAFWCSQPLYNWRIVRRQFGPAPYKDELPQESALHTFWLLHENDAAGLLNTVDKVRVLAHGTEFADNVAALRSAQQCGVLADIAAWEPPPPPPETDLLRPAVRRAFAQLEEVGQEMVLITRSVSPQQRNSAFIRAQSALNDSPARLVMVPTPERTWFVNIVAQWREILAQSAGALTSIAVRAEVISPYIVGAIVPASRLVGREDIFAQIQGMWGRPGQRDSLVIYGHRRMGKSSIVRSISTFCDLGADSGLAVLNLQSIEWTQGLADLCYAIAVRLWEARPAPAIAEPDPDAFPAAPIQTLRRLLDQFARQYPDRRYVLILDEFELLDTSLSRDLANEFITKLRGFTQDYAWLVVALVGLHTLQERSADFYQAIYTWRPIKVGLMTEAQVADTLQVKDETFPLEYRPEALTSVYHLTGGQPFLVQLIGDALVQAFNLKLRAGLTPPPPILTAEDVDAVVADPQFYQQGSVYFRGIWEQAGETPGQQAVLRALAPAADGLPVAALAQASGLAPDAFAAALGVLVNHDVVARSGDCCRYTVELMRRWVLHEQAGG